MVMIPHTVAGADGGPATMLDVATRAGVSITTVSRALRGSTQVTEATRSRIEAIAKELGYSISRSASSLVTGRTGRVALLVGGSVSGWFAGTVIDAMYNVLNSAGLDLLVYLARTPEERAKFFERLPARRNADSLIIISFALTDEERARLSDLGMPVVYLNSNVEDGSVYVEDVDAAADGVRYLLNLGHRRIAYVHAGTYQAAFDWSAHKRLIGFRRVLDEAGVPEADRSEITTTPRLTGGESAVTQLLTLKHRPTAVFAESSEIAVAIIIAARKIGLKVPEELSVMGFDDHELAAVMELTTIAQPVAELAEIAAEFVAKGTSEYRRVALPTRLIVRASTARPAQID